MRARGFLPDAKATIDRLAYGHRLRHFLAIDDAEACRRRIDKALGMLRDG